jgi:cobalamin-dependent methionine synthase I
VFLKHAGEAGLGMAIIDPESLIPYDKIETGLRDAVEDLIRNPKGEVPSE